MRIEDVILNIEIKKMDSFNQYLKLLILERLERIITAIDRSKHEDLSPFDLSWDYSKDSSKVRNFIIKTKIFRQIYLIYLPKLERLYKNQISNSR